MFTTDAHALLRVSDAPRLRLCQPKEVLLELIHAGIGEQQCRIIHRDQRSAVGDGVPLPAEEIKELLAHLRAGWLLRHSNDLSWDLVKDKIRRAA